MTLAPPLTSPDCNLRDFGFMPWEITRFRQADLLEESAEAIIAAILLYGEAWQSVPAASLPNDDKKLAKAAGYGFAVKAWLKVREGALRGFILCNDGRLYHPVVAEKAREAWQRKLEQRHRTFCATIRKHNERHPGDKRQSPTFAQWDAAGRPDRVSAETRAAPQQGDLGLPENEPPVRAPARTGARAMPDERPDENHGMSHATRENVTRDTPPLSRVKHHPRDRDRDRETLTGLVESPQTPLAASLADEIANLAGVRLTSDDARDKATAQVETWLKAGIEPSTIKAAVVAFTAKASTPTRSLHRFDGDVRLCHARTPNRARRQANATVNDDPDPRITELRRTLRDTLGPRTYDGWLRGSALSLNGSGVVLTCPSTFMADWTSQNLSDQLAKAAQRHGLGSVKITTIPMKG